MSQPEAGVPPDPAEQPQGGLRPPASRLSPLPHKHTIPHPKPSQASLSLGETPSAHQAERNSEGAGRPKRRPWKKTSKAVSWRGVSWAPNQGERKVAQSGLSWWVR